LIFGDEVVLENFIKMTDECLDAQSVSGHEMPKHDGTEGHEEDIFLK
jgi:hypothetical protein